MRFPRAYIVSMPALPSSMSRPSSFFLSNFDRMLLYKSNTHIYTKLPLPQNDNENMAGEEGHPYFKELFPLSIGQETEILVLQPQGMNS